MQCPDEYPEVLALIAQTVLCELTDAGIEAEQAVGISFNCAEAVRHAIGGAQIYISRGRRWVASKRNLEILEALSELSFSDVSRYAKIAHAFNLSERWVRNIEQSWLEAERSRRQGKIPGCD